VIFLEEIEMAVSQSVILPIDAWVDQHLMSRPTIPQKNPGLMKVGTSLLRQNFYLLNLLSDLITQYPTTIIKAVLKVVHKNNPVDGCMIFRFR
jgi:hypothetical protein